MIPKREFGPTSHMSSATIFGGYALSNATEKESKKVLKILKKYGVNHIDTAPAYGDSELRIGEWMKKERDYFFLASKVHERSYEGARKEIKNSLERLNVDKIDLIQIHSLTKEKHWEKVFSGDGALKAMIEAQEQGLVDYLGVTGHSLKAPKMHLKSLREFDFDSVLLPLNFPLIQNEKYLEDFQRLFEEAEEKNVAVQTIKSVAKRLRKDNEEKSSNTWYKPLKNQKRINKAVRWVLSKPNIFLNTAGDIDILPKILEAADEFDQKKSPSDEEMERMVKNAEMKPLWPGGLEGGQ